MGLQEGILRLGNQDGSKRPLKFSPSGMARRAMIKLVSLDWQCCKGWTEGGITRRIEV
jgi:hypothetical protein